MRAGRGFAGGLSAGKYMTSLARRRPRPGETGHLVELGALRRTGQLKGTRYWLPHGQGITDGESGLSTTHDHRDHPSRTGPLGG